MQGLSSNHLLRSLCTYYNTIGFQESKINRKLAQNRNLRSSAELFRCYCLYFEHLAASPSTFVEDLRLDQPKAASFFSIISMLPPELQLTITGFAFGTRILAPSTLLKECAPPFDAPEVTPGFYWRAASRLRDDL